MGPTRSPDVQSVRPFVHNEAAVVDADGHSGYRLAPAVADASERGHHASRKSFLRGGAYHDQSLWTILDEDWYRSKALRG